jgi:hypothetical protein
VGLPGEGMPDRPDTPALQILEGCGNLGDGGLCREQIGTGSRSAAGRGGDSGLVPSTSAIVVLIRFGRRKPPWFVGIPDLRAFARCHGAFTASPGGREGKKAAGRSAAETGVNK